MLLLLLLLLLLLFLLLLVSSQTDFSGFSSENIGLCCSSCIFLDVIVKYNCFIYGTNTSEFIHYKHEWTRSF